MLHPSQNRRVGEVREVNTAFVHHGHQIAIAQFVAEVPTDEDSHDLLVKVTTFEQLLDRYESLHLIADSWSSLHQSLENYVAHDVVAYVDAHYRTIPKRSEPRAGGDTRWAAVAPAVSA